MNTLVIVLIAAVCLLAGYALYGRWLAKKWGIDPTAETPAVKHNDGEDYVPTNGWTVFAHQFSSIAGAGPVTGAIQAAAFGWLPVLLWILLGGIFFGAVTDFGALYASVKNEGKSMGLLIEKYIGKTGRRLFLGFCWLFTLIEIVLPCTDCPGNHGGKTNAQSQNNRVDQVDGVLADGDRCSSVRAKETNHGSIDRLYQGYQNLFQKDWPRQRNNDRKRIAGGVCNRNHTLSHKTLLKTHKNTIKKWLFHADPTTKARNNDLLC